MSRALFILLEKTTMINDIPDGLQPLGILMLDTRFPRPLGDLGNSASYEYPVVLSVVPDASPDRVVHGKALGLVDAFVEAARELEAKGCCAIITSCGFLALHQQHIARAASIPVATSALLLVPLLEAIYGARNRIGILTASAASLTREHLAAVGVTGDLPIGGVRPDGEFARVIIGNETHGDFTQIEVEIVEAAASLSAAKPNLAAIVLECTNMPPYRDAISRRCGVPVYDLKNIADCLMGAGMTGP